MPPIGSSASLKQDRSHQAKSTPVQLSMFEQVILPDSSNVISLPALADGRSPSVSPVGRTAARAGRQVSPASRTVLARSHMAAQEVRKTIGTFCPSSPRSLRSVALQSSLESKLRAQLSGAGLMSVSGRWKTLATPAERPYCQLLLSARDMSASGFIGWPTPAARDGRDISRSNAFLSQRKRHSPSMATRLLEQGAPWTVITATYCLAMGFPSSWNVLRSKATATRLSRKSQPSSSVPQHERT